MLYKSDLLRMTGVNTLSTLRKYIEPLIEGGYVMWQFPNFKTRTKGKSGGKKMITRKEALIIKAYFDTGQLPTENR